jgi:hypothetical protein
VQLYSLQLNSYGLHDYLLRKNKTSSKVMEITKEQPFLPWINQRGLLARLDEQRLPQAGRYFNQNMGQLIIHEKDGLLELDSFLLQVGDQVEIHLIGAFVPGIIAHDQRGWYFLTRDRVGIRLQTGLLARLFSLSSQFSPLPVRLGHVED